MTQVTVGRTIAVFHRVKKTVDGESRPTLVGIKENDEDTISCFSLETEREEFDFLMRACAYESSGLRTGDVVITTLGGSGDRLSFAMSRTLDECGGYVFRIPSFRLKECKDAGMHHDIETSAYTDVHLLHRLWRENVEHFFECRVRDREVIRITELYRDFKETQQERMACANRLRARLIGQLYLSEEGKYPEGKIEDWFDAQKATNEIFLNLSAEEKETKSTLERALKMTRIGDLFAEVTGCGPSVIGGLVSAIGDIRRFSGPEKLVSYMGLAVLKEDGEKAKKGERIEKGLFPRQRRGVRTSWNRAGRQTLYTLADQFNRRPESEWGRKFLANKEYYRTKHPHTLLMETTGSGQETKETGRTFSLEEGTYEKKGSKYLILDPESQDIIEMKGKLRYYPGHIHRMAIWKTLREFVHWLYGAWTEFEKTEYAPKVKPIRGRKASESVRKAA